MADTVPLPRFEPPERGARSSRFAKGRRRALGWIIALLLIAFLVIAAVVADVIMRNYVSQRVAGELRTALNIDESTPVGVEIRGISVLAQLAQGRLDRIDVTAPDVTIGELSGSATATGIGVPLDQTQSVDSLTIDFSIDGETLNTLSSNLSDLPITDVTLEGSEILADLEFEVFGFAVPLTLGLEPEAVDGNFEFTPTSISLDRVMLSAEALRNQFGLVADTALATQSFCVAQYLPSAFVLDTVEVRDDELEFSVSAEDAVLDEGALAELGGCSG